MASAHCTACYTPCRVRMNAAGQEAASPSVVESPLVVKSLPGPQNYSLGSDDDEEEGRALVCEGSVVNEGQDDELLSLLTYSEVSVAMLCRTYNNNLRDNTFTLSTQIAAEWALNCGYLGDTTKGVGKKQLQLFYNNHDKPVMKLKRDIEMRRWHQHKSDPFDMSPPATPMWRSPCTESPILRFLKEHSIINNVFFRPPKAHYDESLQDLVYLPLPNCKINIPARWLPFPRSRGVMIFAHGNACDIAQNPVVSSYRSTFEVCVLAVEWPGYGLAGGKATETNLLAMLLDTILYVNSVLDVPMGRIILYGRSLATGPCLQVASVLEERGQMLGGLILKSPYLSWCHLIKDVGSGRLSCVTRAAAMLVFNRFESYKYIKYVSCPLMIIHGMLDPIIPYYHASRLYGMAATPVGKKELHLVDTGDHDVGIELWKETKKFVDKLEWDRQPFVTTLPEVCYDVKRFAERARESTRRRVLLRRAKLCVVGLLGVACMVWGAYAMTVCSSLLASWCIVHGAVTLGASVVYQVADWVQDDLDRAQDRTIQIAGLVSLILLFLFWLFDLTFGHIALFTSSCDKDSYWYACFACMAVINYVFIVQALVTNK
eukprot:TRINITY_DN289_c0_g2_i1.p1 TRINITY_DN289_c0_g2~~TRINITY_DN289_c0_g2_i1.p1  ORF type:complete len:601 (+),score=195.45 TRINITY_DN289_c0_g2_i1:1781-3583(+)